MEGMSDAAVDLFRKWCAEGEMRAELENAQRAEGWVVVTVDIEGDINAYGFQHAAPALEYAKAATDVLNDGGEEWTVKVVPLLPP